MSETSAVLSLIKSGAITEENFRTAAQKQRECGGTLGEILISENLISEFTWAQALSREHGFELAVAADLCQSDEAAGMISESTARLFGVLPLFIDVAGSLVTAMYNPADIDAVNELKRLTGKEVKIVIAPKSDLENGIARNYSMSSCIDEAVEDILGDTQERAVVSQQEPQNLNLQSEDDAPVVRLVGTIIERAVRDGASDIHIEPGEVETKIRFRIDGALFGSMSIPKNLHSSVTARIKILSGMDIAEKRHPQDGKILIKSGGKRVDVRVSAIPSIYGEKCVLRLLDQNSESIGIDKLGFDEQQKAILRDAISAPYGIFLLTGPTGSGKSTTLYSLLELINTPNFNIITVEDPVEYSIGGITQIQVNEKIGFTFENALRSIFRQDPDKLMIGEIRDTETAQLAVRMALTGHFVLSTLHTNDAPSSVNRLLDMGIPGFLLASSLKGIAAQRLVRKLCVHCKKARLVTAVQSREFSLPEGTTYYEACGCPSCRFTGYSGRTAIAEIMMIDSNMRGMINKAASADEIREYARRAGMKTLKQSAMDKVYSGVTSLDEMLASTAL